MFLCVCHGVTFKVILLGGHIDADGALKDFFKALATNLTIAFPLNAVDLSVPAAEAATQEHFVTEVTVEGTEACVYFHVVVQADLSVWLLATFRAILVVFILSVCFFMPGRFGCN